MELSRHTFYIVASYGALAIAIVAELIALGRRRAAALHALRDDETDEDT